MPLGYLLIQAFLHVQILHPLQHFVLSVKMKVAFRCGFGTRMFVLYWHSQVFVLDSPSSKVVFSFARPVRFKSHDLSQLFGQVGMVAQIASPHDISFSAMPSPSMSLT